MAAMLFMAPISNGQVNYAFNFDANSTGWTGNFSRFTGATACGGAGGAMRGNLYSGVPIRTLVSPTTGNSQGGSTTITYDYKAMAWSANTTAQNPWGSFVVQYGATASGPWTTIATVSQELQTNGVCLPRSHSFTPPSGPLFVQFVGSWTNGDYYLNFDNITVVETVVPCAGAPTPGATQASVPVGCGILASSTLSLSGATSGSGVNYLWRFDNGNGNGYTDFGTNSATQVVGPVSVNTSYLCLVTCTNSGLTTTSTPFTITINQNPTVGAGASPAGPFCAGETSVLTATGADTYTWAPATDLSATSGSSVNFTAGAASRTYTVTGTTASCSSTATVVMTVNSTPVINSVSALPNPICANGSSQLEVSASDPATATASAYSFAASSGVFTALGAGGTQTSLALTADDATSTPFPIGFSFGYIGTAYATVSASSNGLVSFGAGSTTTGNNLASTTTGVRPGLAPLWDDLQCTQGVTYQTTGSPGSQVLTIEFLNMEWRYLANVSVMSFQVKLFQATGAIQFIYRQEAGALNSPTASVGIMGPAGSDFISLQDLSAAPAISTVSSANGLATKPATGQIYTFTPPPSTLNAMWDPIDYLNFANINNPLASNVPTTTTYTVTVDNGNCEALGTLTLMVSPPITGVTVTPSAPRYCAGSSVMLTAAPVDGGGPFVYQWTDPNNVAEGTQATQAVNVPGDWIVTISDACGGPSASYTVTVIEDATPTAAPVAGPACLGQTLQLTGQTSAGAGALYSWMGPGGYTSGVQNPAITPVVAGTAGTYSFTVTSAAPANCVSATGTVSVLVNTPPTITVQAEASPNPICTGGSTQLSVTAVAPGYSVDQMTYGQLSGANIPAPVQSDDGVSLDIPIGFSFPFYGNSYTTLNISCNGFVSFTSTANGCCSGQNIPSPSTPNDVIALAWDDLNVAQGGSISYFNLTAPDRFVVEFNAVPFYFSGPGTVTGQIVLNADGTIEIHSAAIDASGQSATQGIENSTGTAATAVPTRNSASWTATTDAYRFLPDAPDYSWNNAGLLDNAFIANPVASNVLGTTNFTVSAINAGCSVESSVLVTVDPPPSAIASVVTDCGNNAFSIGVNISGTGTGSTAGLSWTVNGDPGVGSPITGLSTGGVSPDLGPFDATDKVVVSLLHESNSVCNAVLGTFYSGCPVILDCGMPLTEEFCYDNNESRTFLYQSPLPGETVTLNFSSGNIGLQDAVNFYDGTNNLANSLGGGNFNGSLAGQTFVSTGDVIFFEIISNDTASCADGAFPAASWDFVVQCTPGCSSPNAFVDLYKNCAEGNFQLDVVPFDPGDAPSGDVHIYYQVGAADPDTILNAGLFTNNLIGPWALGTVVNVTIGHTDSTSCNRILAPLTVPAGACPTAGVINGTASACSDVAHSLNLGGASTGSDISYQWYYGPAGNATLYPLGTALIQSTASIPVGSWQLVVDVTRDEGVLVYSRTATFDFEKVLVPTVGATSNAPICAGEDLLLAGSADVGTIFNWSGPDGFSSTMQNPTLSAATIEANGTYTLSVTNKGCSSSSSTAVIVDTAPEVNSFTVEPTPSCIGGTANLILDAGPFTSNYNVNAASGPGLGLAISSGSPPVLAPLAIGGTGATIDAGSTVSVGLNINHTWDSDLDIFLVGPGSCGTLELSTDNGGSGNDYLGTILTTGVAPSVTGGSAPFTGTFMTEGTIADLAGCPVDGSWTLQITDDAGGDDGTLNDWSLTIEGGITIAGTYSTVFSGPTSIGAPVYSGSNDHIATGIASALLAGSNEYTAVVSGPNGCTTTAMASVVANPPLSANDVMIEPLLPQFCGSGSVTLTASPIGGGAPYTYAWKDPNNAAAGTSASVVAGMPGTWSVNIMDNCGGSAIATVNVAQEPDPMVSASAGPGCVGQDLDLSGTTDIGIAYNWTGPNGFSSSALMTSVPAATSANSGTYTLTVTSAKGCSNTATVAVTVFDPPAVADASFVACAGSTVQLNVSASLPVRIGGGGAIEVPAVPTTSGIGGPYPSTINVSGFPASGVTVGQVVINGFSHTWPSDVDILLQSPTGEIVVIMSDAGGSQDAVDFDYVFQDGAPSMNTTFNPSGTYAPFNNNGFSETWPAPGPGSVAQANPTLTTFIGNVNGTWNLFVVDDAGGDVGSIADWAIVFNNPDLNYSWSPGTYLDNTAIANPLATNVTASQNYTVTVSGGGCVSTANVALNVVPIPVAPATTNYSICIGGAVTGGLTAAVAAPIIGTQINAFAGAPFPIDGTTFVTASTLIAPALPGGATVTSARLVLHGVQALGGSWRSEIRVELAGDYSFSAPALSGDNSPGPISPDPVIDLPGYALSGGGTIQLRFRDTFNDGGIDATVASAELVLEYEIATLVQWYDAPVAGTLVGTGTPFDPVAAGAVNFLEGGEYLFYASSTFNGCEGPRTVAHFFVGNNNLNLVFQTDGVSNTNWSVHQQGTGIVVQSGGGVFPLSGALFQSLCLPDGCYYLVVTDDAGDGIMNGGYYLSTQTGSRIIDDRYNFASGFTSAIANNGGFCVPISNERLITAHCDQVNWTVGHILEAVESPAVSAQWQVGDQTDDGYEFWIFDPNGTYSQTVFHAHSETLGFGPPSAARASAVRLNNFPDIPWQIMLNVRVRTRVNGVNSNYGPACRLVINPNSSSCPPTQLNSTVGSSQFSCGVSRTTSQFVYARSIQGANLYEFRFRLLAENVAIVRQSTSTALQLNWTGPDALIVGATYDVEVRARKGSNWCVTGSFWGISCPVTIIGGAQGGAQSMAEQTNGTLSMYPNPNNGQQLYMSITELPAGVNTVSVDILSMSGKRVTARTIAVQDGFVNTVLDLNGDLAAGMYLVNITAGDKAYTERLVIQP